MRQSNAIADRVELKGQASGSVAASQGQFAVSPTQTVFSCWGPGANKHLTELWCKSHPSPECRATCPIWSRKAA